MKQLQAQRVRPTYFDPTRKAIDYALYMAIFKPIIDIVKDNTQQKVVLNARVDAVEAALKTGRVQYTEYAEGVFSGKFSAAISKQLRDMGAKFDARASVYRIDKALVPETVRIVALATQKDAERAHADILKELDRTERDLDARLAALAVPGDNVITHVYKDFQDASKALIVKPVLSDPAKQALSMDYNENMKLKVHGWAKDQIGKMRTEVEANALAGHRYDGLISVIRDQYGASQRKAEFLARQEASLFVAKFRKERLGDAGVQYYRWSARGKNMTRPDHWLLHGRIFRYDDPPIVDVAYGRMGNPGEDFNCLCADIPLPGYQGEYSHA